MLELLRCQDINMIKKAFYDAGFEYGDYSGMLVAKDKNDVLGYSLYQLNANEMIILQIRPLDDIMLFDGILRSTLHIAAQSSIMNVFYSEKFDAEQTLVDLRFVKNQAERSLNIDLLFGGCECCGHKNI